MKKLSNYEIVSIWNNKIVKNDENLSIVYFMKALPCIMRELNLSPMDAVRMTQTSPHFNLNDEFFVVESGKFVSYSDLSFIDLSLI